MDNLLEDIATCGVFQVTVMIVIRLQAVAAIWSNIMMMFGAYNPGWTCSESTATTASGLNLTSHDPYSSTLGTSKSIFQGMNLSSLENVTNDTPIEYDSGIRSCVNLSSCAFIEFDDSANTIVTHFGLVCDREDAISLIILLTMAGTSIGCMFGGEIGERFGRKTACFGSTFILFLSNLIAIFSPSMEVYAAISFIAGIGSGGIIVTYIVYGYEFLNPKWRGIVGGIPSWNLGVALFGVIVAVLKDWRYLHLATCCFSGFSFLAVFWAPESIRWLRAHGKEERLKSTLTQILKVNKREDDVDSILQQLKRNEKSHSKRTYSFLDLFRSRNIRTISVRSIIIISSLAISYFTFTFSLKNLSGNIYTTILLAGVIEIPFTLCTIPLINTFGRRITTMISMTGGGLCSLTIVISLLLDIDSSVRSDVIKYSSLAAKGLVIASWTSFVTLTQELFPTVIRNVGHGSLMVMSRVGAMVSPYLVPQMDDHGSFLLNFICITVGYGIIIFIVTTLPETNKMPLEDWIDNKKGISKENESQA